MSLRARAWERFLSGSDGVLLERLYLPALGSAVRYDRCCAYFSSSVLAAAARGYSAFLERHIGSPPPDTPPLRLLVNEQLDERDVRALMTSGRSERLEQQLLKGLRPLEDLLQRERLAMLAWLAKHGYLAIRVGVMRTGGGILHAKFGIFTDAAGDQLVFRGSGNETAQALVQNYEQLELSTSWDDAPACAYYAALFERLWRNEDEYVYTLPLPEAVHQKLIRYAPAEPPLTERAPSVELQREAMRWQWLTHALNLPNGLESALATLPTDLWPHQARVASETAQAYPEGRLLCDEVGLGKTLEAIAVLRWLQAGNGARRILILTPAGLMRQWQAELREKGGLIAPRYEPSGKLIFPDGREQTTPLEHALIEQPLLILSREWARLPHTRTRLMQAPAWDLVLLDEAHAARRSEQDASAFNSANLLLSLLRELVWSGQARGALLLSATPMQTQPWEPWDLLSVLGVGGEWLSEFSVVEQYYQAVQACASKRLMPSQAQATARLLTRLRTPLSPLPDGKQPPTEAELLVHDLLRLQPAEWLRAHSPLRQRMHRNTRATLREYHQRGWLAYAPPKRRIHDLLVTFQDPKEHALYEQIQRYIETRYAQLEQEQRGKGFVMTVYQRRAVSAFHALQCSLERRLERLHRALRQQAVGVLSPDEEEVDFDLLEELGEEADGRGGIDPALPTDPEQIRAEIEQVEQLLEQLRALHGVDSKRDQFLDALEALRADGRPALVFTQYVDTLRYLRDFLVSRYAERLACYTGEGGALWQDGQWRSASKAEITRLLHGGALDVLLCTDAASEGLNLQAAGALINYDLPWNPAIVEQRIGRIDRIGQPFPEVVIVNMFLHGSIDERVYQVLRQRCGLFERFVGEMQPVLATARRLLLRLDADAVDTLEREAAQLHPMGQEVYQLQDSVQPPLESPPLCRADLEHALRALPPESGVQAKPKGVCWRVQLGARRSTVALTTEGLESEPDALPLLPESELSAKIAARLTERAGATRLPLVIGVAEADGYRCARAYWIADGTARPMDTYAQLCDALANWDGQPPDLRLWNETLQRAQHEAHADLQRRIEQTRTRQRNALQNQLDAARARLQRELLRLLRLLNPRDDPNRLWDERMQTDDRLGKLLQQAAQKLGSPVHWDLHLLREATDEAQQMHWRTQQGYKLGSGLEGALRDPRWRVQTTLQELESGR